MEDTPFPADAEVILCPTCEEYEFVLVPNEAAKCPICGTFTTYGDPDDH